MASTISGTITVNESAADGAAVYVVNTDSDTIATTTTTDSSGNYSVSVADNTTFHVAAEHTISGTEYNGASKPFVYSGKTSSVYSPPPGDSVDIDLGAYSKPSHDAIDITLQAPVSIQETVAVSTTETQPVVVSTSGLVSIASGQATSTTTTASPTVSIPITVQPTASVGATDALSAAAGTTAVIYVGGPATSATEAYPVDRIGEPMSLNDWPVLTTRTDMSGWIRRLRWGPNDRYLYGAGQNAETVIWDASSGLFPVVTQWDEPAFVTGVYPGPDGDVFVRTIAGEAAVVRSVGNRDGTGWDDVATLGPGNDDFGVGAWHPDGDEFALINRTGTVYIYTDGEWLTADRAYDYTGRVTDGHVVDADWSEDGQYLAMAISESDDVVVINPQDGSEVTRFSSVDGSIQAVRFDSRSETMVYTTGADVTIVSIGNPDGTDWTENHTQPVDDATYVGFGDIRRRAAYTVAPIISVTANAPQAVIIETDAPYNELVTFETDAANFDTAEFSSSDTFLALGDRDGQLTIRETPEGNLLDVTVSATIPNGASATLLVYADTNAGTRVDSVELKDGTHTYVIEGVSSQTPEHWLSIESTVDSPTTPTPTVDSVTLDTTVSAGSVLTLDTGTIETARGSLTTQ